MRIKTLKKITRKIRDGQGDKGRRRINMNRPLRRKTERNTRIKRG